MVSATDKACVWDMSHPTHCNKLQHTANALQHHNTPQHAATQCNTLQHTATHCNTLQHTATQCNTVQHTATLRNTLWHAAIHCDTQTFMKASGMMVSAMGTAYMADQLLQRMAKSLSISYMKGRSLYEWVMSHTHAHTHTHAHAHTHTRTRSHSQLHSCSRLCARSLLFTHRYIY